MNVLVGFEDGQVFSLEDSGVIRRSSGLPSVMIVRELTREKLQDYASRGVKVFVCNSDEKECLSQVLDKVFPQCKTCKFA
ncbi:MAG: hypothetical protein OWQ52_02510 [Metallosphaera prunae]|uniref:hypothetical protein n=1 Tax=Metallosphaera prunae TaxID=47304 RepID=UPI002276DF87|nr:hypothetical protein [Metallosphaera prunae]MCY0861279.1 hypothetical protein [Metallosphaera prunae]